MENNKAVAYIRVSTDDQANSIEVQRNKITQYALFKNLEIVEIITDQDVSGHKPINERIGGAKLNFIVSQGNVKIILAVKPDRIFRNTLDALQTIQVWNKEKISLQLVDIGGSTIDTTTAIGKLFFTTLISISEFERNIGSERTKAVINHKKDSLAVYSRPMLGFDIINKILTPNSEMNTIKRIFFQHHSGFSHHGIAKNLNNENVKTKNGANFSARTIKRILANTIYQQYI